MIRHDTKLYAVSERIRALFGGGADTALVIRSGPRIRRVRRITVRIKHLDSERIKRERITSVSSVSALGGKRDRR